VKAFENVKAIVEEAGGTMEDVVYLCAYIVDREHARTVQEVRKRYFHAPDYPATSLVVVAEILLPGFPRRGRRHGGAPLGPMSDRPGGPTS
jgi:enamine deaminase RidA (YjgF/YER057c/UK114 family)